MNDSTDQLYYISKCLKHWPISSYIILLFLIETNLINIKTVYILFNKIKKKITIYCYSNWNNKHAKCIYFKRANT